MRILWIAAICVSWQFSDAYFSMPKFLCIPPFVAINGSCLIPTTTKPLIPPCLKNPQNLTVSPENRKIVTVSPWNSLPEDEDSIGKSISKDKEPSLPIKVPVKPITENSPSAGAVEGGNKDQRLKPIPGTRPGNLPMNPKISQTDKLGNVILSSKKPTKIPLSPNPQEISKIAPTNPIIPDTDEIINRLVPSERPNQIQLPGIIGAGSETQPKVPTLPVTDNLVDLLKPPRIPTQKIPGSKPPMLPKIPKTDHLINGKLPSGDLIGKQNPSKNPKIPYDNEVINGLLPSERPSPIQLPGITGVGSETPPLPVTYNLEDLVKPPGIPPLEMLGSNPQNPKIPKTDHLINGKLPSGDLIGKQHPSKNPKIPDTDEIIKNLLPSERPGITGVGSESPPKIPTLPVTDNLEDLLKPPGIPPHEIPGSKLQNPKIPKTDHLINGKLPSRDLIGKQHPSKNLKTPDTDKVINGLLPSERPSQIRLPGITGVGSGTQPIVPTLPVTDNLEDLLKPPGIPPLEIPGSNPQILPKIPKTDHLINGKLPSGDLIGKQHPSINPITPDTDEVINGLLPSERPSQILLPGITGVGSETPPLPVTDNLEDLLKPPGIPPLEMAGSNPQIPKIPKTDHLINGNLPSGDLIGKPHPPKYNLPGMPKIIDPKMPKLIRPEDLYPKDINIYQLLPKDIFY
ncbi:periaxin [Drosophila teissieri]|uniref:periaxin n=1 Tax=Drosophila teissieri TaxID=7243 RepID=UPI001CBA1C3F|nr:periaxin [Drosophila teissieri]